MQGREAILPTEVDMCSTRQQRHDALHMAVATTHQTKWGVCEMEEEKRWENISDKIDIGSIDTSLVYGTTHFHPL